MVIVFALPEINLAGGTKVVLEYAEFLSQRGHEVTCLVPQPRPLSLKRRLRNFLRQERGRAASMDASHLWAKSVRVNVGTAVGHLTGADFPSADIVIATWWETAEWTVGLPTNCGIKVHFIQDHEVFDGLPLARVSAVYRQNTYKIVVSRWLSDVMRDYYGARTVAHVPNGVDIGRFNPVAYLARTSDIGFVWSTTPRKNACMAVEVIRRLKRERPSLTVRVLSAERCPAELSGLDWVSFHQQPDQASIPSIYADCRLWLFPTLSEGYGLPLLEAMASGTPVVATRAGAAPELIAENNGILVDWTVDEMLQAAASLLEAPPHLWSAMSEAARATALEWDFQHSALAFENALKEAFEYS